MVRVRGISIVFLNRTYVCMDGWMDRLMNEWMERSIRSIFEISNYQEDKKWATIVEDFI
jgi:hypothetical protein